MTAGDEGWRVLRMGDIADIIRGVTYKKTDARSTAADGYLPLVRATNIEGGQLLLDSEMVFVPESCVSNHQHLMVGDIVVATSSGSVEVVGKSALLRSEWGGTFGAFCAVVRPSAAVLPAFLSLYLQSANIRRRWSAAARGTNINNLKRGDLVATAVPVPPLAEQWRIVEILEDHLSRLDAAVALLSTSRPQLRQLTRSLLEQLVPTSPVEGWERATVEGAGRLQLGRQRHPDWHSGSTMRPYLRVANVFEARIDTSDVMEMDFSGDGLFERFKLVPGDILLNEGQSPEFLGRPAMYRGDPPEVAFTNSLIRFQAYERVIPEWALLVFRRHMHAGRFMAESRITTNIAHLSLSRLRGIEFPIPPLHEQRRICAAADARLGAVGRLRLAIDVARRRQASLRSALLTAAFSGRLTGRASDEDVVQELAGV